MFVLEILYKKIMETIILLQGKLINRLRILCPEICKRELMLSMRIKRLGKLLNINPLEINMII
jgi:hypothetical protein